MFWRILPIILFLESAATLIISWACSMEKEPSLKSGKSAMTGSVTGAYSAGGNSASWKFILLESSVCRACAGLRKPV